ncbi:MAG: replicative DNA helicase [Planctomycetota bacterium]
MITESVPKSNINSDFQYPYDVNAESALLGALILDNSQLGEVAELIKTEYFYHIPHQLIFSVILELYDRREPFDSVIIKDELIKKGNLDKAGGIETIVAIFESVPTASNAIFYAQIIREKYILRRVINICNDILQKSSRGHIDSENLLEEAQKNIFQLAVERDKLQGISIKDIVKDVFNQIRDKGKQITGLPFGLSKLDELTGGLHPSQFIVIAGRPGSGKSSFGLRLLEEIALKEKKPVVLYTLEVTAKQVVENLLCSTAKINSTKLRSGFLAEEERRHLLDICGFWGESPVYIDDTSGLSVFELRNRSRRLKSQYDIQLIMVDYLQLMRWENAENREREIAYISSSLKGLAKELNIPVVAMAQLSRESERREPKKPVPRLSDLRESGAIEQDADVVLLLYRGELYDFDNEKVKNKCDIYIGKQRNGPSGMKITVSFLKEYYRFENYTGEEDTGMMEYE